MKWIPACLSIRPARALVHFRARETGESIKPRERSGALGLVRIERFRSGRQRIGDLVHELSLIKQVALVYAAAASRATSLFDSLPGAHAPVFMLSPRFAGSKSN